MRNHRILGIGELGWRLVLAFVVVALAAIATLALLDAASTGRAITRLVGQQERNLTAAVAVASGSAYDHVGWARANLGPVFDLVSRDQAAAQVRDKGGRIVRSSADFAGSPQGLVLHEPIFVRGRQVGRADVLFGDEGLGGAVAAFDAERWRARLLAAGIAALIAVAVSLVVARWITAPLESLLVALRARAAGDRGARVREVGGGVLRELLEGFNWSTDALDRRERLQRNLVADIAHELRTPVAILQAGHEAMLDGVAEPTPANLGSLRDEVLRLARMVGDLQRLSAAESAALQLALDPHDLAGIAAGAASSLADSYTAAGVTLVQDLTPVSVLCDAGRVREITTNLLTNALKFTPAGGTVVLEVGPGERRAARLRVADTGVGISADDLPRVTERFFRSGRSAAMAAGSGIGLTIVDELVRAHRGRLDIVSEPDAGTEVTVCLPRADLTAPRQVTYVEPGG